MRKINLIFTTLFIALLISCSGSDGQDGIDGVDGSDGIDGIDGKDGSDANEPVIFSYVPYNETWELNESQNRYQITFETYIYDLELEEDDVIFVYRLEQVYDDGTIVWRQMPQPYMNDQGILFYNFDFAIDFFSIYLEAADFNISDLQQTSLIEDEEFRIVIVPSTWIDTTLSSKINYSDIGTVMQSLNLNEDDIIRLEY